MELSLRMNDYFNQTLLNGYKMIEFRADLEWGGTRRKRREQTM